MSPQKFSRDVSLPKMVSKSKSEMIAVIFFIGFVIGLFLKNIFQNVTCTETGINPALGEFGEGKESTNESSGI